MLLNHGFFNHLILELLSINTTKLIYLMFFRKNPFKKKTPPLHAHTFLGSKGANEPTLAFPGIELIV